MINCYLACISCWFGFYGAEQRESLLYASIQYLNETNYDCHIPHTPPSPVITDPGHSPLFALW